MEWKILLKARRSVRLRCIEVSIHFGCVLLYDNTQSNYCYNNQAWRSMLHHGKYNAVNQANSHTSVAIFRQLVGLITTDELAALNTIIYQAIYLIHFIQRFMYCLADARPLCSVGLAYFVALLSTVHISLTRGK